MAYHILRVNFMEIFKKLLILLLIFVVPFSIGSLGLDTYYYIKDGICGTNLNEKLLNK